MTQIQTNSANTGDYTFEDYTAQLVQIITEAAWNKKALGLVALDVESTGNYYSNLIICSGRSDRHTKAIADEITKVLRDHGIIRNGIEGYSLGHWILLDFDDVLVHVFHSPVRERYNMEGLWHDAIKIPLNVPEDLKGDAHSYGNNGSAW